MNREHFDRDLEKLNRWLRDRGALIECEDGFVGIDESKAPESLINAYSRLLQFGYANGLL